MQFVNKQTKKFFQLGRVSTEAFFSQGYYILPVVFNGSAAFLKWQEHNETLSVYFMLKCWALSNFFPVADSWRMFNFG